MILIECLLGCKRFLFFAFDDNTDISIDLPNNGLVSTDGQVLSAPGESTNFQ